MAAVERGDSAHAGLMDGVYRHQRHIYDLTRKYYLLGRDRLIEELDVPAGGSVLELGCGTGRNLLLAARRYPDVRFYGIDISAEMLATAGGAVRRAGLGRRVSLARGDAADFDLDALFGIQSVDRVFISYSLSMIPPWRETFGAALDALSPRGSLHIVDFGQQEKLPPFFGVGLRRWLALFHVTPRPDLADAVRDQASARDASVRFRSLHRGYAWHIIARKR